MNHFMELGIINVNTAPRELGWLVYSLRSLDKLCFFHVVVEMITYFIDQRSPVVKGN